MKIRVSRGYTWMYQEQLFIRMHWDVSGAIIYGIDFNE